MSYLESEALCPYYREDRNRVISCEIGKLHMRDAQMLRDVGYKVCAGRYKECPLKVALDSYYERQDGDPAEPEGQKQIGLW